jgi:hypothetical protein
MRHSNNYNQTILSVAILLVLCFGLLASKAALNYIPATYSKDQVSSFQAEAKALDDIPSRKVKVGDIDIAYK